MSEIESISCLIYGIRNKSETDKKQVVLFDTFGRWTPDSDDVDIDVVYPFFSNNACTPINMVSRHFAAGGKINIGQTSMFVNNPSQFTNELRIFKYGVSGNALTRTIKSVSFESACSNLKNSLVFKSMNIDIDKDTCLVFDINPKEEVVFCFHIDECIEQLD